MTELQLLIRDSNGMPPVIRADYLEDSGYDIEAQRIRLSEWSNTNHPDVINPWGDADGFLDNADWPYHRRVACCWGWAPGYAFDDHQICGNCDEYYYLNGAAPCVTSHPDGILKDDND